MGPFQGLRAWLATPVTFKTMFIIWAIATIGSAIFRFIQMWMMSNLEQKIVERGKLVDGLRVIRSGLAPGDKVVISGMQRSRPGLKVDAKPGKIEQFPAGVTRGTAPAHGSQQ